MSSEIPPSPGIDIVCLLAEGHYFYGAAALCNSLLYQGFRGEIVIGYRGTLPAWEGPIQPRARQSSKLGPDVHVRFEPVDEMYPGDIHLSYLKPSFMLTIANRVGADLRSLWYFDADIVAKASWGHFARWSEAGLVLFLDIAETYMPATHVYRRAWQTLASRAGLGHRAVEGYFNSGCVGLGAGSLPLLQAWHTLIEQRRLEGARLDTMNDPDGWREFGKGDQDLLNAAVMACDVSYAVLGMEAMDAFPSADILSHAMFFEKPWRRGYILDALKGFPPDAAHRAFWAFADGPIRPFSRREWRSRKWAFDVSWRLRHFKRRTVREW